jgi:hypothetical protein
MADTNTKDIPHKEIDVDFPLEVKRADWPGDKGYVYIPPKEYNFFAICSKANDGLLKESSEHFSVPAYEKENDGFTHVGLPYSFTATRLYKKNVLKQIVKYGDMMAIVIYTNEMRENAPEKVPSVSPTPKA